MKFRIEYIAKNERPVYLFARQLEAGGFSVSPASSLGGAPIKAHVSQPRSLTPEGKPDLSVFTFYLATESDLPKLSIGQVVDLE